MRCVIRCINDVTHIDKRRSLKRCAKEGGATMYDTAMVAIQKMDVLMEDYNYIQGVIDDFASDINKLIEARNTWEVFFAEYDNDPREIFEIPEIVNWIEQSIEAGIPWFYFMKATTDSLGLSAFMIAYGGEADPEIPGRYFLNENKTLVFIKKNLKNLELFSEKYNIPDKIACAATDSVMAYISAIIHGDYDHPQNNKENEKDKMLQEALQRLTFLEKLYGLNHKVKKYFEEGELYYSYITGGGFIGSVDTIQYDPRYVEIVENFEGQTGFLVYHVIERNNTIALLYVSGDNSDWVVERPQKEGVLAHVFNVDDYENERGFIKIDILQGALYRINDTVYPRLPGRSEEDTGLSVLDSEIVERLEILINAGLLTDLSITDIYTDEGVICFSELHNVLGQSVGVVNRIDAKPAYKQYAEAIAKQVPYDLYFMMLSLDGKMAFLYVSDDEENWVIEKLALEKEKPHAIVVDLEKMTASVKRISYKMINGGPLFIEK